MLHSAMWKTQPARDLVAPPGVANHLTHGEQVGEDDVGGLR